MSVEVLRRYVRDELWADDVEYRFQWHGYEVWAPVWSEPVALGPPIFILVRGGSFRQTDPDEGFEILDCLIKDHPELCKDRSRRSTERKRISSDPCRRGPEKSLGCCGRPQLGRFTRLLCS